MNYFDKNWSHTIKQSILMSFILILLVNVSSAVDTQKGTIESQIAYIRSEYSAVQEKISDEAAYFEAHTNEGYYVGLRIHKDSLEQVIKVVESSNRGAYERTIREYFYNESGLFFVYSKRVVNDFNDEGEALEYLVENRYYFHNDQIIRHLNSEDKGANTEQEVSDNSPLHSKIVNLGKQYQNISSDESLEIILKTYYERNF